MGFDPEPDDPFDHRPHRPIHTEKCRERRAPRRLGGGGSLTRDRSWDFTRSYRVIQANRQNKLDRLIYMLYNITNIIDIESYILFITKFLIQDKIGRLRTLLACIVCLRILGVGVETGELFAA